MRQAANPNAKVCCVVKADAYGHGAVRMAQEFEALGADWFAVSNLEEALQLRLGGISQPMLVPVSYTHLDVYKRQGQSRRRYRSAPRCLPGCWA